MDIETEDEHLAAPTFHPRSILGTPGDDAPGLAGIAAGARNPLDGVEALGVLEIARVAEYLAEVGGPDKEEIDIGNRGDLGDRGDGAGRLDLDTDEGLGVGAGGVLGGRDQPE